MVLALFAPLLNGFAVMWQSGRPSCGMSCCKTGKSCCHKSTGQGRGWSAASRCPSGCGQIAGLAAVAAWSPTAQRTLTGPALQRSLVTPAYRTAQIRFAVELTRFQRPPPHAC